jgi:hypothetical protein
MGQKTENIGIKSAKFNFTLSAQSIPFPILTLQNFSSTDFCPQFGCIPFCGQTYSGGPIASGPESAGRNASSRNGHSPSGIGPVALSGNAAKKYIQFVQFGQFSMENI